MFVIRLYDPLYNSWGYCLNGVMDCMGKTSVFYEDDLFASVEEAKRWIAKLLASGWYRTDITESNFTIVEAKRYEGFGKECYYTEESFNRLYGDDIESCRKRYFNGGIRK